MRILIASLLASAAAIFLLGGFLHIGVPLGSLHEPRIVPAVIVESLCGILLVVAALAVLTHRTWAWRTALTALMVSIGGVLVGIVALAARGGPRTVSNDLYHQTMLALMAVALLLLLSRRGRVAVSEPAYRP